VHEGSGCRAYRVAVALILVPFNLLVRHEWRHAERLPRSGGVIIAANHISTSDPLVLGTPPAVPFHPRPLHAVPDADGVRRSA
jgi:1-acyl-sn-glycerol-3-phosphate acyltransferase